MFSQLLVLALGFQAAAVTSQTSEAVSRASALAATADARFDVVSQLDVDDVVTFETQRQLCGAESESCVSQLAGAYDARLVLFLRIYQVGTLPHVAMTLRDVKNGRVLQRGDVSGDETTLFEATKVSTVAMLQRFTDHPAEGTTRLFISRAAVDAVPTVEAAPLPTASGPPVLTMVGAGAGAGGVIAAIIGAVIGVGANGVLTTPTTSKQEKNDAEGTRLLGYSVIGGGAALAAVGAGLVAVSMGGEP